MLKKISLAVMAAFMLGAGIAAPASAKPLKHPWSATLGMRLYPGLLVHGDPGWLPAPYYAWPVSMFGDLYRIGVWRRTVRTNFRSGLNARPVRHGRRGKNPRR